MRHTARMGRLSWVACAIILSSLGCGAHVDAGDAAGSGDNAGSGASGSADAGASGSADAGASGGSDAGASGRADAGASGSAVDTPGPVMQRAGVLYEGTEWTKPADSYFDVGACRIRPLINGCEGISSPEVMAAAVDGQRLVVAVYEDPNWALLVSDDLGKTVRRFALEQPLSYQAPALHLFQGRIFVNDWLKDPANPNAAAPIFEVDPLQGGVVQRGADGMVGLRSGSAADGSFTSVGLARDVLQAVSITRFDPATNRITRTDLPCTDQACAVADPFHFRGGDLFVARSGTSCIISVHVATTVLDVECPAGLADEVGGTPLSSFGSAGDDFELVTLDYALYPDVPWSLFPLADNWLRAGPAIDFAPFYLSPMEYGFFAFSPSGFVEEGDDSLLRLRSSGTLEQSKLAQDGCLSLSSARYLGGACAKVVSVLPLAGDEVLLISLRDEFNDDVHSRWLFDVSRSNAPFTPFTP